MSLKGILHHSLKIPPLLPLPPPPRPEGLDSPWVDPNQGSCLAPAISRPPLRSFQPAQHCRVILSRHCCYFHPSLAPRGWPPHWVQTALPGFPPLSPRPHPADLRACCPHYLPSVHSSPGTASLGTPSSTSALSLRSLQCTPRLPPLGSPPDYQPSLPKPHLHLTSRDLMICYFVSFSLPHYCSGKDPDDTVRLPRMGILAPAPTDDL